MEFAITHCASSCRWDSLRSPARQRPLEVEKVPSHPLEKSSELWGIFHCFSSQKSKNLPDGVCGRSLGELDSQVFELLGGRSAKFYPQLSSLQPGRHRETDLRMQSQFLNSHSD